MKYIARVLLLLLSSLPALPAFGQEYPNRPITMVVPFSAGGPGDVIARLLGTSMSATLKQSIVIENVVGAGGTLGTNRVAKATPDGYTLLLMHVGQATAPALNRSCRSIRSAISRRSVSSPMCRCCWWRGRTFQQRT